jgi:hypothetical protein
MSSNQFNVNSFAMKPEYHRPTGSIDLNKMYTFNVQLTMLDQAPEIIGTVQLTPDEYSSMLTTYSSDFEPELNV